MKKHISLITASTVGLVLAFASCSQVEVPKQVSDAFTSQYKDAVKIRWSMESDEEYEAEFHLNKMEMSANYTADGQWVETEKEILRKKLPTSVTKTLDAKYSDYKVEEATLTETAKEGSFYEIEIEKKKEELILRIDMQGNVIKTEVNGDEDNKKGEGAEADEADEADEAEG